MKDYKWQVVVVVVSLLGAVVSVFAISDRFVTIREWQQSLSSIDARLGRIETRLDINAGPVAVDRGNEKETKPGRQQ